MALRINTNIAALNAHKNLTKTDNALSSSLEKLSSGLRINKAADDASGMSIADSLKSQSLGLGQAIRNGNDAISIVQTADAALEESINIVNTIKTKSIQAAQDGQTTTSRKAIQSDIEKLTEELDNIAKTTSFNGQKLLSGNFTNKEFQIGAYSGETIGVSIQSTEAAKIGHLKTSELTLGGPGTVKLDVTSSLTNETYALSSVELAYNNSAENGVGVVADALNKLSDVLGITATASVETTTKSNIEAGTTDASFAINGVTIGALDVQENDADGALVTAINNKSSEHGVVASVDEEGLLTLTSSDNRAIQVTMGDATQRIMGGTENMSTFGTITLTQAGTGEVQISDANNATGVAVSTVNGSVKISGAVASTQESVAADGTIFASGTVLGSGSVVAGSFTLLGSTASTVGDDSIVSKGSVLAGGTVFACGTTIQGTFEVAAGAGTSADGSILTAGSTLASSSSLAGLTIFKGDISTQLSGGTVIVSGTGDNQYTVASGGAVVKAGGLTLTENAEIGIGSLLASGSILTAGSMVLDDLTLVNASTSTVTADMTLTSGSVVASNSVLKTGSSIDALVSGSGLVQGTMTLGVNTTLADNTQLADGSSFGASATVAVDIVVGENADMVLTRGSQLNSGTVIAAGTLLTNEFTDENGFTYSKGTLLDHDITLSGTVDISNAQVIAGGSTISAGSTLAANNNDTQAYSSSEVSDGESYRLSDIDVTTQEGAQIGIAVADAALTNLDKVRSDLGSVQNQLTSTIANISTTKVNVEAAESTIRDVDFAAESSNFTKMQILSQAGTFAMSQANASSQNVLSLLQ